MTMIQTSPIEPFDDAVGDYRRQAREFMLKSRQYLADGDLHQASEKGWGAAAWMAKPWPRRRAGNTRGTTSLRM